MIHQNAPNRCTGLEPEETRPLAALTDDDRHSPLASGTLPRTQETIHSFQVSPHAPLNPQAQRPQRRSPTTTL